MTYQLIDKAISREAQNFFKSIDPDWMEKESGNTESPMGWFALVTIDEDWRKDWNSDLYPVGHNEPIPEEIENGRYLVVQDNNGIVWAYQTNTDATDLGVEYMRLEQEYSRWDRENEDDF